MIKEARAGIVAALLWRRLVKQYLQWACRNHCWLRSLVANADDGGQRIWRGT